MKYTCPCCGYKTFEREPGSYDICSICFWEDDKVQLFYPHMGGANINLIEAQKNFELYGAIEKRFVPHVHRPTAGVEKDSQWRKFDPKTDGLEDTKEGYFENVKAVDTREPVYYWLK